MESGIIIVLINPTQNNSPIKGFWIQPFHIYALYLSSSLEFSMYFVLHVLRAFNNGVQSFQNLHQEEIVQRICFLVLYWTNLERYHTTLFTQTYRIRWICFVSCWNSSLAIPSMFHLPKSITLISLFVFFSKHLNDW